MDSLKRFSIYIIVFLIAASVYHDLKIGTPMMDDQQDQVRFRNTQYNVVQITAKPGDTVLSIMETINHSGNMLDIKKIYNDFERINQQDPQQLIAGHTYLFPLYAKKEG